MNTTTKHQAICEQLKADIQQGKYPRHIPGGVKLAQLYGVNFKTANKAVATLIREGLLYYVKGRGAFLKKNGTAQECLNVEIFARMRGHLFDNFATTLLCATCDAGLVPIVNEITSENIQANFYTRLDDALSKNPRAMLFECEYSSFYPARLKKYAPRLLHPIFAMHYDLPFEVPGDYVLPDYYQGMRLATEHLAALGHRRIMYVSVDIDRLYPKEVRPTVHHSHRLRGFLDTMIKLGLESSASVLYEKANEQDVARQWQEALTSQGRPTAVVVTDDWRYVRMAKLVKSLGLAIPRDLAIVGFHNTPWCEQCEVPLTSVSIRQEEVARIAVGKIVENNFTHEKILVPPELVVRESCGGKVLSCQRKYSKEHSQ